MDDLIGSIKSSIESENYFGALFMSVCIPDICGKIQDPTDNKHYKTWFERFMPPQYKNYVTGGDAYAIRSATLHAASNDLALHQAAERLDKYYFTPAGSHLIMIDNLNNDHIRRCVLSIRKYCEDIITSYQGWLSGEVQNNDEIKARYDESEKSRIKVAVGNDIPGFSIN